MKPKHLRLGPKQLPRTVPLSVRNSGDKKADKRNAIIARDGLKCFWCGCGFNLDAPHNSRGFPTLDHVKPKAVGGPNGIANLVLACDKCNTCRQPGTKWMPKLNREIHLASLPTKEEVAILTKAKMERRLKRLAEDGLI